MKHIESGFARLILLGGFLALATLSLPAQDMTDTSKPLDEAALFGGDADIVRIIDTQTASAGDVSLVADNKKYPVFILEGQASAGIQGAFVPYGAVEKDPQTLSGAVNMTNISLSFLPMKNAIFNLSADAAFQPTGLDDLSLSGYADLRASEFTRAYVSAAYDYSPDSEGFSLDEAFIDAAIDRALFFRLGKQRVSWGVGNWFKPADVLSLAAIDPDNPAGSREGPFAFKVDMPFALNHATLYAVPPLDGELTAFSLAERTDVIVGGYELSLAGFYRTDWKAKPRLMFMFTGALGPLDVYGENVVSWGSDRVYARAKTGGGYEAYLIENTPVFQSTLGVKYSLSTSDGLGLSLHVQGYYNGSGYADSSILRIPAALTAIKAADGNASPYVRAAGAGMYYLAGNISLSARFGGGEKTTSTSLGGYALANFSDGSVRFKPSFDLSIGSGKNTFTMQASVLASLGEKGSEYAYAKIGNALTPSFSVSLLSDVRIFASMPLLMGDDYVVDKASLDFGLTWNVLSFE